MDYRHILITGGAGFVGSNLAVLFKDTYPMAEVVVLDNLKRRGSELNLPRLAAHGIKFVHGDIRNKEDLEMSDMKVIDLMFECSAEASVMAGHKSSPDYLLHTNLLGTMNCLELARLRMADFVFLSSSRVYPIKRLNEISVKETPTRFEMTDDQYEDGVSKAGITEDFPLGGSRSLYGSTKLCSEYIIQEYGETYGLRYIINRCGCLAGRWQFGNVDQGVFTLWLASHYFNKPLKYIGWGSMGKQVRDVLHVEDLFRLLAMQVGNFSKHDRQIYNVGGGYPNSLSLLEATMFCHQEVGFGVPMLRIDETRPSDIKTYITDNFRVTQATGWAPEIDPPLIFHDIYEWIRENEDMLRPLFGG